MTRELLLQLIHDRLWILLFLTIVSFSLTWYVLLALGLQILRETTSIKRAMLATLIMLLYAMARSFIPVYIFWFLMIIINTLLLMFLIGKLNFSRCAWAAIVTSLISSFGNLTIELSLGSLNQGIFSFFFNTQYGNITGAFVETLFPALTLVVLKRFKKVSLIPSFDKFDIIIRIGLVTIASLVYIVYYATITLYFAFKETPQQIPVNLKFLWVATVAATLGIFLLLIIMNRRFIIQQKQLALQQERLESERQQREFERQRYETELRLTQEKIDALNNEIHELKKLNESLQAIKTTPEKILNDIAAALNNAYGAAGRLEDYKNALKSQMESGIFKSEYFSGVIFNETEIKIIELITEGKTNEEIGKAINLSAGRVSNIITDILAKTGARDRTVLAVQYVTAKFKNKN